MTDAKHQDTVLILEGYENNYPGETLGIVASMGLALEASTRKELAAEVSRLTARVAELEAERDAACQNASENFTAHMARVEEHRATQEQLSTLTRLASNVYEAFSYASHRNSSVHELGVYLRTTTPPTDRLRELATAVVDTWRSGGGQLVVEDIKALAAFLKETP